MKLLRLPSSKVQLGVPLPWNVRDAGERLLLSKGQTIDSQAQLDSLMERGAFVDFDDAKAAERLMVSQSHGDAHKRPPNLFSIWDGLPNQMRQLMDSLKGATDAPEQILAFVRALIALVEKDVDIALYHAVRQENADLFFYGYSHSIHAAVLGLLMARRLNWPEQRIHSLMCAAVTMNVSILGLQGQMAKQDVPARESQLATIRQHPIESVRWLQEHSVNDSEWVTAVLQHHERPDGSGYHQGLTEVAEIAIALRVTDVFMAKISPRKLRAPLPIREAARQLYGEDKGGPLSSAIIKEFGVYPPGEVVKLVSGEMAVVVRRSGNPKCPEVACITDAQGRPTPHTLHRDTASPEHAIANSYPAPASISRLPPERIYGYASVNN